jgi:hypothetical protein
LVARGYGFRVNQNLADSVIHVEHYRIMVRFPPTHIHIFRSVKSVAFITWLAQALNISVNRTTMGTNIPDFTRYLKKSKGVYWQALFMPFIASLMGIFGIIAASAGKVLYGTYIWDPLQIAAQWDGPAGRCGAFFVGLCWVVAQIGTNISANVISCSNDMVSVRTLRLFMQFPADLNSEDNPFPQIYQHSPWRHHHNRHRRLGHGSLEDHLLGFLPADFYGLTGHFPGADFRHYRSRLLDCQEEAH